MSGTSDALSTKTTGVSFIDPYELATLDPYGQRNLEKFPSTGKIRILAESIEHIRQEIMTQDETFYKKDLEKAIDTIYQHAIEKENIPLDVDLMARVFLDLEKLGLKKLIKSFEKLDHFDEYNAAFLKKQEEHERMLKQKAALNKNAEEALKHERYNDAISTLQEMISLDPNDEQLPTIVEQVQEQRIKKIKNLIAK
jgi:two-component SAPR family response regulator